jgi:predicted nucleotidyltransferase component of viral defense system
MNDAIRNMLSEYRLETSNDYQQALREIFQSIALLALWRAKFFESAAFYGGTALRILYKLDRFSEDMDFSLLSPDSSFKLEKFDNVILEELKAYGFEAEFKPKKKVKDSAIKSAFLKANTIESLIAIDAGDEVASRLPRAQKIKIKIEIDTDPPPGFDIDMQPVFQPIPFQVKTFTLPDLFAGKMHAALYRKWKKNVKGRDWYDLVWYAGRYPELRLSHLEQRMRQSSDWTGPDPLTPDIFLKLYHSRLDRLDIDKARNDVEVYLTDPRSTDVWSKDYFKQIIKRIQFI